MPRVSSLAGGRDQISGTGGTMASISKDPSGRRRIWFFGTDGRRRWINCGRIDAKQATALALKVETLIADRNVGRAHSEEICRWIVDVDRKLREQLERAGLIKPIEPKQEGERVSLGDFLERLMPLLSVKPGTLVFYG